MKKSRFSEQQMTKILREEDKSPVAQVAKHYVQLGDWDSALIHLLLCSSQGEIQGYMPRRSEGAGHPRFDLLPTPPGIAA